MIRNLASYVIRNSQKEIDNFDEYQIRGKKKIWLKGKLK